MRGRQEEEINGEGNRKVLRDLEGEEGGAKGVVRGDGDAPEPRGRAFGSTAVKKAGSATYAPDERDILLRFCVWPRLRHLLRTIRPGLGDATFRAFDRLVIEARLKPLLTPGGPTRLRGQHHSLHSDALLAPPTGLQNALCEIFTEITYGGSIYVREPHFVLMLIIAIHLME